MKRLGIIAAIAASLAGCGDDTSSEARLTAAANLFGRSFDGGFELEGYTTSPIPNGLTFTPKKDYKYGVFSVTEKERCKFTYRGHYYNTIHEVNFNLLNMDAARSEPSRNPAFSIITVPGISGALVDAGKTRSQFLITHISPSEAPIFLKRLAKFKEMCPGRA